MAALGGKSDFFVDQPAGGGFIKESITQEKIEFFNKFTYDMFVVGARQTTDGITTVTLPVTLARNTIVEQFDVVVKAARADATLAANVAILRVNDATSVSLAGNGLSVVIDFGTLRTVSAVQVNNASLAITRITPWTGAAFAPTPAYATILSSVINVGKKATTTSEATPPSNNQNAILPSEIRTERLLVEILGKVSAETLAEQLGVILPEPPADLELKIDGGAPVWKSPGAALAGTEAALTEDGFNKNAERLAKVGEAFAALTGDPLDAESVTFNLELTTRVPGVLELKPQTSVLRRIWRVKFGSATETNLEFGSEGVLDIPLELPAPPAGETRMIEEIRFTAVGNLGVERVLPPVGPDPGVLADLTLDSARAALVRLSPGGALAELTAVRLPLSAGAGGAEARLVLWSNKGPAFLEPVEAMPSGTSEPVTITEGAEAWVTFPFKKPVKLDATNTPWAAIVVARGQVLWNLGQSSGADTLASNVLRLGPPGGPWKPLPPPFLAVGGALAGSRGRTRVAGTAQKQNPLAPLLVNISASSAPATAVTPTAKGTAIVMKFSSPVAAAGAVLRVVSHLAGTVTFRDIDVISNV